MAKESQVEKILADLKRTREEKSKLDIEGLKDLKKRFKKGCDNAKREEEKLEKERILKHKAGTTRSGTRLKVKKRDISTDGKWINKGIDESKERFDSEEIEFIIKSISKVKEVNKLNFDQIRYLIIHHYLDELKKIKAGEVESDFHKRFKELQGGSLVELRSEIRTGLFTNDQRDYVTGLIQGAFDTMGQDGDINHSDIDYVSLVILAEITIRIVKYVHKFKSNEEALAFIIKSSRAEFGIESDDN